MDRIYNGPCNGDGHGNGYDHDCCGSTTTAITTLTMVTIAATWWLRPRLRQLGGYDHGNGYDHDCCGSTTTAITTLAMVTIAAAMATIAEPMSGLDPPSHLGRATEFTQHINKKSKNPISRA